MGHRVVNLLVQMGERVTVVAERSREDWLRSAQEQGVEVVLGDARDPGVLTQAGIENAAALIAATDRDAINIDLALEAKQRRSDLPIVIRLFDQQLAAQIESVLGVRSAFAMAAVAAPTFAATASDERISSWFEAGGDFLAVGRLPIEPGSPLVGLSVADVAARWDLAGIAYTNEHGTSVPVAGGQELGPGDQLVLVGALDSWRGMLVGPGQTGAERPGWLQRAMGIARQVHPLAVARLAWVAWRHAPIAVRGVSIVLGALVLLSLVVVQQALDLGPVDALYFVITTLTTTGYGDISARAGGPGLMLYTVLLMLAGSATLAVLFSIVTDFVVTARFEALSGRRQLSTEGHIVVVGLGNVGYRTMAQLARAGERVVGIERNADGEFVQASRALGPVIIGDARLADTLDRAEVSRAKGIVAVTPDDATNLTVGLAAKQRNPEVRTVVQLLEPNFARKAQGVMGIDASLSAPFIAAPSFAAAALYPDVCHAFVHAFRLCILVEQPVGPELDGLTPQEAAERSGVLPLLTKKASGAQFVPLQADDFLSRGERVLGLRWREQVHFLR